MDLTQLRTFVTVAREGTITRASLRLHLSQPAVSAHIKSLEEGLGLTLFSRVPRGMELTVEGERLLVKVEQMLTAHQQMLDEATRIKGSLSGRLRLGACSSVGSASVGYLLKAVAERYPEVEVSLEHGSSAEIFRRIIDGSLDAGYYNEAKTEPSELSTIEVERFQIFLAAAPGLVPMPVDWEGLAAFPWIYPEASACCALAAEELFRAHNVRPRRVVSVDREGLTRTLLESRLGVGLLHEPTALRAQARGELDLLAISPRKVRVLFAHRKSREEPLLSALDAIARESAGASF